MVNFTTPYNIGHSFNTIAEIYVDVNNASGGLFGILILVLIAFVLFGVMKRYNRNEDAFLGSMIITIVIALLMRSVNIITDGVMILMILGLIIAFIYYERA